ncbi:MAG: hypothetical protein HY320_11700 [Armatimonadetes bacterium]|nr:hypothetical protein [Armatimonadota bacterium]
MEYRNTLLEALPRPAPEEIGEEFPLRVVPDWSEQVRRATQLTRVIDRHLDYEARGRLLLSLDDFRPQHLCPEQRMQCITDAYALTR